jgi:ubiquinone/menaquinone biosynthesis C-methylase UbiE
VLKEASLWGRITGGTLSFSRYCPQTFMDLTTEDCQKFAPVAVYFNAWEAYQKVIQHNYMEHLEVTQILHQYLASHNYHDFSFLDLGCGDASFSTRLLSNFNLSSYTGIDLSSTALELAYQNLSLLNFDTILEQQEILNFLLSSSQEFNVILSAFSIHHLSGIEKEKFFAQVKKCLKSDGVLLFVDVFREEGENRTKYIERYRKNIHQYWTQLTLDVKQSLIEHIESSDYPEWESTIRDWSEAAGFQKVELLYQGGHNTQKILAIC